MNPWATPDAGVQPTLTVRQLVFERDQHMCAGVGIAGLEHTQLTIQHRLNRGMGGDPDLDSPQWLMCLCATCNVRLEQDAAFAALGRAWGWKLTTGEDPTEVCVWFAWAKQWRRLDAVGGATRVVTRDGRTALSLDPFAGWREDQ